jgi:hypothetical protein
MVTRNTPVQQMSEQERQAAFEKWLTNQTSKKNVSAAKRNAMNRLKAVYEDEYNAFFEEEKGKLG